MPHFVTIFHESIGLSHCGVGVAVSYNIIIYDDSS